MFSWEEKCTKKNDWFNQDISPALEAKTLKNALLIERFWFDLI